MKKIKLGLAGLALCFVACQSNQKQPEKVDTLLLDTTITEDVATPPPPVSGSETSLKPNPNAILVSCDGVGKITFDDTYETIERKAGKANVELDSMMVNGVFQHAFVTKVWKGTAGELTINWQESKPPYQTIQNIIIDKPGTTYVLQNGIKLGSSLSLFNKLNGKPVMLIGFAGKNAGTLMSFDGGNLMAQIPCVRGVFALPPMKSHPKEVDAVLTPNLVQSDQTAFKIYDPTLVKIIINSKR
ncbi:hypothetical protein VRU48_00505 [Pedobacter sp. KR3-3]|uniref:Lipoprotein n=1 Tax=Pedobacter albus TaxID=3113905 RepID=A0ABU7I2G6_9SPHI|nr:hypothetical protein [Pedobacter sp. KR3-3]MEE1943566.1 hypothetical protein [Pedobacter sp. KR3-3]